MRRSSGGTLSPGISAMWDERGINGWMDRWTVLT